MMEKQQTFTNATEPNSSFSDASKSPDATAQSDSLSEETVSDQNEAEFFENLENGGQQKHEDRK